MREPSIRGLFFLFFITVLVLGATIWSAHRSDNQRRQIPSNFVFESRPAPKLQEVQRMIYEQGKKEAAELEIKKLLKRRNRHE